MRILPHINIRRPPALFSSSLRYFSSSTVWDPFQLTYQKDIDALPESIAAIKLSNFLRRGGDGRCLISKNKSYEHELTSDQYRLCLDASMATFSLHVHARIASLVGQGFYTIGPCGEELLSGAGMAMTVDDTMALHYRHTAISIARQLQEGNDMQDIMLSRARGYTVSKNDPVTGGVHCSIGGTENDFIVTSTLASQCPAAVGRALGFSLAEKYSSRAKSSNERVISFCTIGDGSVHNHHFLSAWTLARHASHLNIKCPIVFGISNNGLSISYETKNFISTMFRGDDPLVKLIAVDGQDIMDVYNCTKQATEFSRKHQKPAILLYDNLVRRFGHAATDRQIAYLDPQSIQAMVDTDVLALAMSRAVQEHSVTTFPELSDRWAEIHSMAGDAFQLAMQEDKVSLDDMMDRVSASMISVPRSTKDGIRFSDKLDSTSAPGEKPQVMRKQMTRVIEECMEDDPSIVYLGEDVRHGGYYLVTDGLAKKFPSRVLDVPPDETTLLGVGMGFSQLGLTPIVEIPYAKYLDCGVDMFYEIAIMNWLSNGKRSNGMIIRLQGFDRGIFGGNFHTHNMMSHIPPGIDVVCYSNGADYVRGFRNAIKQAKAGRVVMLVDCTNLLNLRHLHGKDRGWEFPYPSSNEMFSFDDVVRYSCQDKRDSHAKACVVAYGNGVITSLQARRAMAQANLIESEDEVDVIDCPLLSTTPEGLKEILPNCEAVLFADICKEGPGGNIFSSMIASLQQEKLLPSQWSFVGAPRTYNPLGSTATFLNQDRIQNSLLELLKN